MSEIHIEVSGSGKGSGNAIAPPRYLLKDPNARCPRRILAVLCALFSLAAAAVPAATPVEVVVPTVGDSARIMALTGSFTARRAAALSPRLSGLVARVAVDAGDRVAAGQPLVELDDELARLEVRRAQAVLEEQRVALDEAERLRDEARRLGRDRVLPETEVDAREAAAVRARAALSRAEAELATAQARLARHAVIAPFPGTIARKRAEAGEWVETGTPVVELVDEQSLWLDVQAPQQYWPDLGADARARVTVDALPDQAFDARVHARVPVSDPAARTFLVRLAIGDLPAAVTPGMSARVRFEVPATVDVLQLPRDALIRYPDGTVTVWVIDESGDAPRAREIAVRLGRTLGNQVEILGGLDRIRPVVSRGNEVLSENEPVRITNRSAAP